MLDISFVRENLALIEEKLRQRGMDPNALLRNFSEVEKSRREIITRLEGLQRNRNVESSRIAELKKKQKEGQLSAAEADKIAQLIEQGKKERESIPALEEAVRRKETELKEMLSLLPNLPHASVPAGKDSSANLEVRRWGSPPKMDFPAKPHWELGESLGILDLQRAAKISGSRFAVYWGVGARLERALANFMLDVHTREHGYTEVLPPYLVNSASMYGTGQLPKFSADLFKCEHSDLWLIPTAEVPLTNLYRDEIIDGRRLPISLTAYSPCFRSEAGTYGQDVRGIIRHHQFQKVELVKFSAPERSYEDLETLTGHAESILRKLGLHYRVMLLATGDMGFSAAKTYDLEVWLPGQNAFREISSCSNFEAFQARRANIRWRALDKKKTDFVHTLNGSGLAVGRTWLAIMENYQQADGTIIVPEALRPYVGEDRINPNKEHVRE